jgi:2-polyprenyl-3-methyl-5-hydroxy-6-metoxy-1,4-benzoquinol methylase
MDFDNIYKEIIEISGTRYKYHTEIKPRIKYIWERISDLICSGGTVVEIGVGPMTGLVKQLKNVNVIAVDHVYDQQALCRKFNIELRICDLQTTPLPLDDESVDMILMLEVIEHLCIYPKYVLDEIYRKLKPGGYLVISTVNFLRISNRIRVLMGEHPLSHFEPSEDGHNHVHEFVPADLTSYMKKSGFIIEATYRFGLTGGSFILSMLLKMAYLYPCFRNYFMVVAKK